MRIRRFTALVVSGVLLLTTGAACARSASPGESTITVAYERFTDAGTLITDNYLADVKRQFEAANPGKHVNLLPVPDTEDGYYAKLNRLLSAPGSTPDLVYEDTYMMASDIGAGFLRPLDDHLAGWADWDQFQDTVKAAATGRDGKVYGVPDGTDTRGIWYNKKVFARAGLPVDWHPTSWADLLAAARRIRTALPDVTPAYLSTGKVNGEATAMQGLEMLLYGTEDRLYDRDQGKWVIGSRGLSDALSFVHTVYSTGLGPDPGEAIKPEMLTLPWTTLFPQDRLGFTVDGSWDAQAWLPSGPKPWAGWADTMGWTAMPTQHNGGRVSLSGGWTWSITRKSENPDLAFAFLKTLQTRENAKKYDIVSQSIAVRKDVAADPEYARAQPCTAFFTDLVRDTQYRPATPEYPRVSQALQQAMETVTVRKDPGSVEEAARAYDEAVTAVVGAGQVLSGPRPR